MASFDLAIPGVLKNEGGFADRRKTTGEVVNMGITASTLRGIGMLPPREGPITDTETAFVKALSRDAAIEIYRRYYWDKLKLGSIVVQPLANKVFDLVVNAWAAAGEALQLATNDLTFPDKPLLVDGVIGSKTIAAVNSVDAGELLVKLRLHMARKYWEIAENHPKEHAGDLQPWLERLERA